MKRILSLLLILALTLSSTAAFALTGAEALGIASSSGSGYSGNYPVLRVGSRDGTDSAAYVVAQQNRLLESRNALLEEISAQQKPLTDYARNILSSTQTVTITQIAQDYGFSAVRFNELLMRLRIQHKVGGQWILYSPYLTKGYVQSFSSNFVMSDGEEQVKVHTRWTQSGRLFLYEELKKAGVLPLIELN